MSGVLAMWSKPVVRDAFALALIAALVLGMKRDLLLALALPPDLDLLLHWYPTHYYIANELARGSLPLWNPYVSAGFPFTANVQAALFYPLSLLFQIDDFRMSVAAYQVFHFFLAGASTYLYLRVMSLSRAASAFGAVVFVAGGSLPATVPNVPMLGSMAWAPLAILCAEMLARTLAVRWAAASAVVLALDTLAGHVDAAYYLVLGFLLYVVWRSLSLRHGRGFKARSIALLALALGLAVSLVAIIGLPALEFARNSNRATAGYAFASQDSMHPNAFLTVLLPRLYSPESGPAWGHGELGLAGYVGVPTLLLSLLALLTGRGGGRFPRFLFAFMAIAAVAVSLGQFFPLHRVLYLSLPGFSLFRGPYKILFLYSLSMAVLAAVGTDDLLRRVRATVPTALTRRLASGLLAAGLAAAGIAVLVAFAPGVLQPLGSDIARSLWSAKYLANPSNQIADHYRQNPAQFYSHVMTVAAGFLAVVAACAITTGLSLRRTLPPLVVACALVALLTADLTYQFRPVWPAGYSGDVYASFLRVETASFLKDSLPPSRLLNADGGMPLYLWAKTGHASLREGTTEETDLLSLLSMLPLNSGMLFGLQNAGEGPPATLDVYREFVADSGGRDQLNHHSRLPDLLGVKYVLSLAELTDPKFELAHVSGVVHVYLNRNSLPRAFAVGSARVVPDRDTRLALLADPAFEPTAEALLEEPLPRELKGAPDGRVTIASYDAERVMVETDLSEDALVILSDLFYPGWEAFVDGEATAIYRTDHLLRSVLVSPGAHRIEFVYVPWSFRIGAAVSLVAAVVCVLLLLPAGLTRRVAALGRRRSRRETESVNH